MIVLRSIFQNHLVFNSHCGNVDKVAVQNLMLEYGGDTTVEAVEKAAKFSRCRGKTSLSPQLFISVTVSLANVTLEDVYSGRDKATTAEGINIKNKLHNQNLNGQEHPQHMQR